MLPVADEERLRWAYAGLRKWGAGGKIGITRHSKPKKTSNTGPVSLGH